MNKVPQGKKYRKKYYIKKKNVYMNVNVCMIQINDKEQDGDINYFNASDGSIKCMHLQAYQLQRD